MLITTLRLMRVKDVLADVDLYSTKSLVILILVPFERSRLIDYALKQPTDRCVRQRPGVFSDDVAEYLFLTTWNVYGHTELFLYGPDSVSAFYSFIHDLKHRPVEYVDTFSVGRHVDFRRLFRRIGQIGSDLVDQLSYSLY